MSKKILITGSTDGIGKLAAFMLAKDGHHIWLHGRNKQKLSNVINEVKSVSGNNQVDGFVADFSNLDEVKSMAGQVNKSIPHLNVLINNAGVYKSPSINNKDGLEMRFVVNYLAPFILTNSLLPLIKKGDGGRILNVSSAAQSSVSYEVMKGESKVSTSAAYAQSKLALTMWSFHLASQLDGISVISVNPGSLLNTKMVREGFGHHWSPADKGGKILYELAVSQDYQGNTAQYFDNDRGGFRRTHADAYKEKAISSLIDMTNEIVRL